MATIKDLKDLDLGKVETEALAEQIKKLIKGYDAEKDKEDKELFIEINQKFIDKFFAMTGKNYPDALKKTAKKPPPKAPKKQAVKIPDDDLRNLAEKALLELADIREQYGPQGNDSDLFVVMNSELSEALDDEKLQAKIKKAVRVYIREQPGISDAAIEKLMSKTISKLAKSVGIQMTRSKPDDKKADKEKSKKIMEEIEKLEPELKKCRATIRDYNKKKREAEGPKPKKSRYTLLKERVLSLARLIPDKFKEDKETLDKTEKILLNTHRELVNAWGMGKVMAKHGEDAIKDKFDAMEEKAEK